MSEWKCAMIELTNICNFDCNFCPNQYMKRKKGFMRTSLAKKVIDEISEKKLSDAIVWNIMGEPMLHPNLMEIIEHASKRKIWNVLITNGSLMTKRKTRELLVSGVSRIIVSYHTPDEKAFLKTRTTSIGFEEYKKRIKGLLEQRIKSKVNIPLHLQIMNTSSNRQYGIDPDFDIVGTDERFREIVSEWREYIEKIKRKYGAHKRWKPRIQIGEYNRRKEGKFTGSFEDDLTGGFSIEMAPNMFLETREMMPWNVVERKTIKGIIGGCNALKTQFGVFWDGRVTACCQDYDAHIVLGDVNKENLTDILSNKRAKRLRTYLDKNLLIEPYCRVCMGGQNIRTWFAQQVLPIFEKIKKEQ